MNSSFEKAFEKFDECMNLIGKGIEDIFKQKENKEEGTKIRIKKDSIVYIGKGIHAKLLEDVEAMTTSVLDKKGNIFES